MKSVVQIIELHRDAAAKPALGAPCNGCGVCCAAEPCPVGRRLFGQIAGSCPALYWQAAERRYVCGVLQAPGTYLPYLPRWLLKPAQRWLARRIAAGRGCDSDAELLG